MNPKVELLVEDQTEENQRDRPLLERQPVLPPEFKTPAKNA